jgi:hypothetical protein
VQILFAIFRQTIKAAFRSKVFYVLLILNLLAVVLLPWTVSADGTAVAELQLTLTYSLTAVTGLLSFAALWLGCTGLAREIEAYNLHLVFTKPARPWLVWVGKWLGVSVMTSVIFAVSALLIYVLILWNLRSGQFSPEELDKVRNEVLVGRRVFEPAAIDFVSLAKHQYEQLQKQGLLPPDHDVVAVRQEIVRQIRAKSTEVEPYQARIWRFNGVRTRDPEGILYFRYRLYAGSTSSSRQRFVRGVWSVINPAAPPEQQVAVLPQRVMSGAFHEFRFPAGMVADDGTVIVQYTNYDEQEESVIFQAADGPELLQPATGFAGNYVRAGMVTIMRLTVLAALGCTFGAAFSTPVAVFVAIAYLLFGAVVDVTIGAPLRDEAGRIVAWKFWDVITFVVAQAVDKAVISFRAFNVASLLSRGILIDAAKAGMLFLTQVVLRGLPMALLGIWILSRRELGKVIRR